MGTIPSFREIIRSIELLDVFCLCYQNFFYWTIFLSDKYSPFFFSSMHGSNFFLSPYSLIRVLQTRLRLLKLLCGICNKLLHLLSEDPLFLKSNSVDFRFLPRNLRHLIYWDKTGKSHPGSLWNAACAFLLGTKAQVGFINTCNRRWQCYIVWFPAAWNALVGCGSGHGNFTAWNDHVLLTYVRLRCLSRLARIYVIHKKMQLDIFR